MIEFNFAKNDMIQKSSEFERKAGNFTQKQKKSEESTKIRKIRPPEENQKKRPNFRHCPDFSDNLATLIARHKTGGKLLAEGQSLTKSHFNNY